jgi:site-specific DNA-methyltransferase (adenine-specific)
MKALPDDCVDLVLTSPPYNVGLDYQLFKDEMSEDGFRNLNADWVGQAARIAREGSRLYAVLGDKMLWWFRGLAEAEGWIYAQMLAWCKPNIVGGGSRISGDWNYLAEWILLFRKGKRTPMLDEVLGVNTHSFFVIATPQSNWNEEVKQHPAQWPEELPRRIIARSPGETVFDPFIGSGTTAVAAKKLGRHFLGFEINPEYCRISEERLALLDMQPSLFGADRHAEQTELYRKEEVREG